VLGSGVAAMKRRPTQFLMNTPTHETIAQRAYEIWQDQGCPAGRDTEIWFEAERQLGNLARSNSHSDTNAHSHSVSESQSALAQAERAALQKKQARAPIVPVHTGPKTTPPESGKPLWDKPHSS
jgi:hypothetical protein